MENKKPKLVCLDEQLPAILKEFTKDVPTAKNFGKWHVYKDGSLSYDKFYHIGADRLTESNWYIHLEQKSWFNPGEFMRAYVHACRNAKVKTVNFNMFY